MMFLYRQNHLCYVSNDDVRILQLDQSPQIELVLSIPLVLEKTVFPKHGRLEGKFSLLHMNDGILFCFYEYHSPQTWGNLLAIDTKKQAILLSDDLTESDSLWARHAGNYLYCGVLQASSFLNRLEWILYTYDMRTGAHINRNYWLQRLSKTNVGSEVCFEIVAGYFYGVSVQPALPLLGQTDDTSWHYWCIRFPVDKEPDREHVEEAPVFRRLHSDGPVDHRWTTLSVVADEETGAPTIIETRKEWLNGGSDCPRSMYRTKIDFSENASHCLKVIQGAHVGLISSKRSRLSIYTNASAEF